MKPKLLEEVLFYVTRLIQNKALLDFSSYKNKTNNIFLVQSFGTDQVNELI